MICCFWFSVFMWIYCVVIPKWFGDKGIVYTDIQTLLGLAQVNMTFLLFLLYYNRYGDVFSRFVLLWSNCFRCLDIQTFRSECFSCIRKLRIRRKIHELIFTRRKNIKSDINLIIQYFQCFVFVITKVGEFLTR